MLQDAMTSIEKLHLPILPSSTFLRYAEDSEVISSKLQPIVLSCIMENGQAMARRESRTEKTTIMVKD
eukprot:6353661-Amphidinium_carterae.1